MKWSVTALAMVGVLAAGLPGRGADAQGTFEGEAVYRASGLEEIPIAPAVTVNSIIAVDGDSPVETGDDGVAKYTSAHLDSVESELVVRSPHSTQGRPETIEEVRRTLRLHAGVK